MRALILFLLAPIAIFAQPFSAGIKAGIPITDPLTVPQNGLVQYTAPTQRYIVGGVAELHLPAGFGIEVDALYRNLQYSSIAGATNILSASGSNWEFPLLLKYRFHTPLVRPFVDAGVAWDTITGLKETINQVVSSSPQELQHNTTMGVVVGAGVDIHPIFLHISPEIRYTWWATRQIDSVQSTFDVLRSNQNQAEFLVGITF